MGRATKDRRRKKGVSSRGDRNGDGDGDATGKNVGTVLNSVEETAASAQLEVATAFILMEHKLGISFWCIPSMLMYANREFERLYRPFRASSNLKSAPVSKIQLRGEESQNSESSKARSEGRESLMHLTQCILMVSFYLVMPRLSRYVCGRVRLFTTCK